MFSKLLKKLRYWRFIYTPAILSDNAGPRKASATLLLSIAFNESSLVGEQISMLKKNFQDPFVHIVVDNSSDLEIRKTIQKICRENGTGYAGVPVNPYKNNKSHAAAMHWAYFQLVKGSKFQRFGFLDHDMFPFAPFSLDEKMQGVIYGRVMHAYFNNGYLQHFDPNVPYWSLWAGFCFFEKKVVQARFPWSLNFFSKHFPDGYFLDTGGGLWNSVYSKIPYPGTMVSYRKVKISESEASEIQDQNFEILDESWIHFVSLSNWREIQDFESKKKKLLEILTKYTEN